MTPDCAVDNLKSEYIWRSEQPNNSHSVLLPAVRKLAQPLAADATIADLGCGNGYILAQFRGEERRLCGFDVSHSGIEMATAAYPSIQFGVLDLTSDLSTHALAGECDLVISTEVVEHVYSPRIFARNCFALLKPGGRAIISTPYHGYWKNLALAATGGMDGHFTALWDHGHIKFWSRRTLTALLEEAGFDVIHFAGVGRIPYLWKSMVIVARRPVS